MPDPPSRKRLCASDVLNWNHMVTIAAKADRPARTLPEALAGFAYDFTSTDSDNVRDQMLADFLHNATDNTSKESAEEVIRCLADYLRRDRHLLRQFRQAERC